jgi:hypothetical protein
MQAFLIERLYPTGWRRSGELYWRLSDVDRELNRIIAERGARGVRVLPVRIGSAAVIERVLQSSEEENLDNL